MAGKVVRKRALQKAWVAANAAGHGNQQVTTWCVTRYPQLSMSADMLSRFKGRAVLGDKPCGALEQYLITHGFLTKGEVGYPEPTNEAPVYILPAYEDVAALLVKATIEGRADLRAKADDLVREWAVVRARIDAVRREYEALDMLLNPNGPD